jgi:hypothetical protein
MPEIKTHYTPPDQKDIINTAFNSCTERKTYEEIKDSVDSVIMNANDQAKKMFFNQENKAGIIAITEYFQENINPRIEEKAAVLSYIANQFKDLDKFFLSLAQARRSRAGITFEAIIRLLFEKLDIPHSYQPVVNGKPDFIVPGKEEYLRAPQDTIVVTAKRTVRERWRQITTEGARGYRFFLATIDKDISGTTLNEMAQNQVTLIIPQAIIDEKKVYQNHSVVKNYKYLFDSIIPHCLKSFGLHE